MDIEERMKHNKAFSHEMWAAAIQSGGFQGDVARWKMGEGDRSN